MSANLLVDLQATQMGLSLGIGGPGSGIMYPASGATIGLSVNLGQANTFCNLIAAGNAVFTSGQLRLQVQCADSDVSGSFTDPTSGLPSTAFPTNFQSGGLIWLSSGQAGGNSGGVQGGFVSGQAIQSGWMYGCGFQRPQTFARINTISGDFYAGTLVAGFISQLRTTGSGFGTTQSPGSGTVSV